MSKNSDALSAEFERRLGRRSPLAHNANQAGNQQREKKRANTTSYGTASTQARISSGSKSLPADLKRRYKLTFGAEGAGDFQRQLNDIVDKTVTDLQKKIDTESAIMQAIEHPGVPNQPQDENRGFLDGLMDVFTKKGPLGDIFGGGDENWGPEPGSQTPYWQGLMEDYTRSPVGRALDIVSRPMYGIQEGLQSALEAGYGTDGEGGKDDFWHSFDDFGSGFREGITGREKTGPGDVWHTMRENSNIAGMQELRDLDESHPGVTRWLDRGVGFAGEVTMDPLNWVGGGYASVLKESGEQLVESSAKTAVREVADTVARDYYDNVVSTMGGTRYRPTQDAIAARAAMAAEDQIEKSLLEITGGGHAGHSKMGGEFYAQTAANRVAESVKEDVLRPFNRKFAAVEDALEHSGNLAPNSWSTHLAQSPELRDTIDEFRRMMDEKANAATQAGNTKVAMRFKLRAKLSDRDLALSLTKNDLPDLRKAAQSVRNGIEPGIIQHVFDEVYAGTRDLYYNTIGIRVGNKTIPIKTFGKAYTWAKEHAPKSIRDNTEKLAEAMSYERNFPGRLSLDTQFARSVGADAFEQFHSKWVKLARDFTQDEDKILARALQDETLPVSPKIEAMRDQMRDEFNRMHADEVANGARTEGDKLADDYLYVFNKKGDARARKEFKSNRKKEIRTTGRAGRFNLEGAKAAGLGPVDSAFESLLLRKIKSTRDISRALFMRDLIENYGISTKPLSGYAIERRGLVPITKNRLPQYMRDVMDKTGERFYLPKEHMELFNKYAELSGWTSRDTNAFVREWSKVTNVIKWMSTVPRAGFHIRNFLGDIYMGLMDNVPMRTYNEVFEKYIRFKKTNNMPEFRLSKNYSMTFDEMEAAYNLHANSGFYETEIPLGGDAPAAGQRIGNARKKVANKARQISDRREDFGRFTHFVAAMRQEWKNFEARGITDVSRIREKAIQAATWRVNHYKFDYGALTATERKIKLLFPFYTFTRKAVPTLLQQLWLNPKYMSLPHRFMEYNDGSAADNFNHYFLPPYVKDMGYAIVGGDQNEPFYMTQDILPTAALNSLDFTNMQQFSQSVTQQMNPLAQIPFEQTFGRAVFSGAPTGSFPEYMMNKFSMPGQLARQIDPRQDQEPGWLQAINESFVGAGIPLRQFTEQQQDYGLRDFEDRFIQDPFSEFNRQNNGYRVYQSNQGMFKVESVATGQVIYQGPNPSQALQYARQLSGQ